MKICITSCNYENYKPLADLTWPNKVEYAKKHGYDTFHKNSHFIGGGMVMGFEKIKYILDLLKTDKYDYIFFLGSDTLIMNYTKKIEDIIAMAKNNESFIVATDCNGINMDSFIVKNDHNGLNLFERCFESAEFLNGTWPYEQLWFWNSFDKFKDKIKIVPQRTLNSYLLKRTFPNQNPYDKLMTIGEYEKGDFVMHWPGTSLKARLALSHEFLPKVIKK